MCLCYKILCGHRLVPFADKYEQCLIIVAFGKRNYRVLVRVSVCVCVCVSMFLCVSVCVFAR